MPDLLKVEDPEKNIHRGIGLYSLKENGYWITFSPNIDVRGKREATRPMWNIIPPWE